MEQADGVTIEVIKTETKEMAVLQEGQLNGLSPDEAASKLKAYYDNKGVETQVFVVEDETRKECLGVYPVRSLKEVVSPSGASIKVSKEPKKGVARQPAGVHK